MKQFICNHNLSIYAIPIGSAVRVSRNIGMKSGDVLELRVDQIIMENIIEIPILCI